MSIMIEGRVSQRRVVIIGEKGLFLSNSMDPKLLSWNVRGLENRDRRITIHKALSGVYLDILVLQETKIAIMSNLMVKEIWGKASSHWTALPSLGASGGILLIWNEERVEMLESEMGAFSISIQ